MPLIVFPCRFQAITHKADILLGRFDAGFRFLLKGVQDIHRTTETHRIGSPSWQTQPSAAAFPALKPGAFG